MNLLTTIFHAYTTSMMFAWPIILALDTFGRSWGHIGRRLSRGIYWRWLMRKFTIFGGLYHSMMFCGITFVLIPLSMVYDDAGDEVIAAIYSYIGALLLIDWITGSDDPPWKKLARAKNKLLANIKPMPRPAIDLS